LLKNKEKIYIICTCNNEKIIGGQEKKCEKSVYVGKKTFDEARFYLA
jgi:hypothetical protein